MAKRFVHDQETLKLPGRRWLGWQTLVWTGLVALLLYTLGLGNHTLWDYHEPYVGGIVREMASSGDWVVPTLNGHPYLEKPPLFYAFGALLARAFHSFEPWVLRLPSGLLAMATTSWVSFVAWRVSSARAASWAAFMLATSVLFFTTGHEAVVDMTLTAAVTFGLGMAYLAILEPPYRRRWVPWFWVGLGLAFLAKGPVGPFMILVPVGATVLLERDRTLLRAFAGPNWGMAAALLLAAGWVVPLALRGGREFLVEVFLRNTVGRFMQDPKLVPRTGVLGEHVEPLSFYFTRTPGNVLPWFAVWAAALAAAVPRRRRHHLSPRTYFLPLAFALNLAVLSLSEAKRMVYLLPALPVTFLHAALWLDTRVPRARRRIDPTLTVVLGLTFLLLGLLSVGFPWYVAARAHFPGWLALLVSLGSLAMFTASLRRLWWREFPRALDWGMGMWSVFLAVFLVAAVPDLDRASWRPLVAPYKAALALERTGAKVYGCGLSETHLGHAGLTFGHRIPELQPQELAAALDSPEPRAVLVSSQLWDKGLGARMAAAPGWRELPTEASASSRLRERTALLIVNPAVGPAAAAKP